MEIPPKEDNMPETRLDKPTPTPTHHKEALENLYFQHGVGCSVQHKLRFWDSYEGPHCYSRELTDDVKLAGAETSWLIDHFPTEFYFC